MRIDWEQIIDAARGLADEATLAAITANPESLAKLEAMRAVAQAATAAPESFVNRAKALLPVQPATRGIARLVYSSAAAAGLRSGSSLSRDLRFESEIGPIELRCEGEANSARLEVVGLFGGEDPTSVSVRTVHGSRVWCDEEGQFELTIEGDPDSLVFGHAILGVDIEVKLK